ncbi:MAG: hypothetical protein HKN09_09175, partial [Saprospiraceae bacterium]|nr:hypothetical protein [Saprospiraceae bacterium]
MKSVLLTFCLCAIALIPGNAQNLIKGFEFTPDESFTTLDENIEVYQLYRIDINKEDIQIEGSSSIVVLDLDGRIFNMNLYEDNITTSVEYQNRPHLLGGSLNTGGIVTLTINDDYINGYIRTGDNYIYIENLRNIEKGVTDNLYVVYNANDVIETGEHICGVQLTESKTNEYQNKMMPTTMCKLIDFAIANTYDMVTAEGSVTNVINHNLAVLNNVQTNYRSEFNANLEFDVVAHFVPATSGADPFPSTTNASTLLSFFDGWGDGGGNTSCSPCGFGVNYNQASLWTDRDITFNGNSGTVGLAQTPGWHHVLENYTSSAASLQAMVSHEKGHNYAALHDPSGSNFIMAPSVTITPNWSTSSVNAINGRVSRQGYLSNCST